MTIRASVRDVEWALGFAIVLVVLVIFLFLRDARATLIPSVAAPLSLIGTFAAMYLLGFSLNNLTLMALTVAAGFVVDDAIVMTENIARYIEGAMEPRAAALAGPRQIGFTIVSLTLSLIAVLIPLLFMGDVVGRLFREFAVTLAVAILISAAVSLTLAPMLCASWSCGPPRERGKRACPLSQAAVGSSHRSSMAGFSIGLRPSRADPRRRRAHASAHPLLYMQSSPRAFSAPGQWPLAGGFGRAGLFPSRPWRSASRRSRKPSSPTRMSRASLPSSASTAST